MKHAANLKLHAHWEALRAARRDGTAPGRDDIDPGAIRDALASVFLVEVAPSPEDSVFRLSGTRLDALFGRPLRGTAFRRIWSSRSAPAAAALLERATARAAGGGRPAVAAACGGPPGRDAVDLELLLLPLDGGRRALGSLAALSTPGWMGLAPASPLDVAGPGDRTAPGPGRFGRRRATLVPCAAATGPQGRGTTAFKFRAP